MDLASAVWREVEVEAASTSDGGIIDGEEVLEVFDAFVFGCVVEPAWADGDVAFGGDPVGSGAFAAIEAFGGSAGVAAFDVDGGPAGVAGHAPFITDPAHIGAGIAEHYGHGLEVAYDIPGIGPVVVGAVVDFSLFAGAAVEAIAAVGAIEPDGEQGAVVGEEFLQLVAVVGEVFGLAVLRMVTVPRRQVYAELDALFLAGIGEFANDVAFSVFPGAVFYGVIRVGAGPEAESVVVFGGEDQAAHSGHFGGGGDLGGVEAGGVEDCGGFVTVAPFLVGECIYRKVDESVEFHVVPGELACGGDGAMGCGGWGGLRGEWEQEGEGQGGGEEGFWRAHGICFGCG